MTPLVPIALLGWIPVILILFTLLPARRAVLVAFVAAWLFLPMASYPISGLPNYDKVTATCYGALIGAILFDGGRLFRFRPTWFDVPALMWLAVPALSSFANGYGPWDAGSALVAQLTVWGIPYLLGRVYFSDADGLRELAVGVFVGGLVYVPLCLYEIRMSPQLHNMVYGFFPHVFAQTKRFGGWRPTVFMQHGLMVGMWMAAASLVGCWLWWTGSLRGRLKGVAPIAIPVLLVTTVLVKSVGAIALLAAGLGALATLRWLGLRAALFVLVLIPAFYEGARVSGVWDGSELLTAVNSVVEERSGSLEFRLHAENRLVSRALERPGLGWGGWGGFRTDDEGNDIATPDGMWVIVLGKFGLVGLACYTIFMAFPAARTLSRLGPRGLLSGQWAGAAGLTVVTAMYGIDNLFNAMINPVFVLGIGGLAAVQSVPANTSRAAMPFVSGGMSPWPSHRSSGRLAWRSGK